MARVFNRKHSEKWVKDEIGFGGNLTAKMVQKELARSGRQMLAAQLGVHETSPPGLAVMPLSNPLPTASMIDSMGRDQLRNWMNKLGLKVRGTPDELKARLKKRLNV